MGPLGYTLLSPPLTSGSDVSLFIERHIGNTSSLILNQEMKEKSIFFKKILHYCKYLLTSSDNNWSQRNCQFLEVKNDNYLIFSNEWFMTTVTFTDKYSLKQNYSFVDVNRSQAVSETM